MKRFVIAVTVALSLALAGCQDARVTGLEKRVDRLEQTVHQLESDRNKSAIDDSARRTKLESCVAEANAAYNDWVTRNGTKQRDGSYSVPVTVMSEMQRVKQGKVEECRLLYSK